MYTDAYMLTSLSFQNSETSKKMEEQTRIVTIDEMLDIVGPFGTFQKIVNVIFCLMTAPQLYQIMIMFFSTDEPSWRCAQNSSKCKLNGTFDASDSRKCTNGWKRSDWVYTKPRDYSIVTHFDINCKNKWITQLLISIFFVGWLLGAFVLGYCADNYGRKITVTIPTTVVLVVGLVSIFMPNLYLLVVCRFIIGFFIPGTTSQLYLITEIVDSKHRPFAVIIIIACGVTTLSILGIKAYFIRDWRYLNIACTAPYIFVVFFFKFIPESVRYLRVKGEVEELNKTFQRIARWNKKEIPSNVTIAPLPSTVSDQKSNPLHLFRTPSLASKTLIQTFAYFTNGLVYYGLYLAATDFGGDKYRVYILISIAEVPICFLGIDFCERFGRKKTSVIPMLIAALACVALGYIPKVGWPKFVRITVGIIGKCLVGSNATTMATWSMEIYPTILRGEAMGFFQAFLR